MKKPKDNYKQMRMRWLEHAQLRAMERYGIAYSTNVQFVIQQDIKNKVYNLLLEIPNTTRVVYRGRLLDKVVTFIFCNKHHVVVTFLHNSWILTDTDEFEVLSYTERRKARRDGKGKKKFMKRGINLKLGNKSTRKMKAPRPRNYKEKINDEDDFTT